MKFRRARVASAVLTRDARLACFVAMVLSGVVYLNALHNPFVFDDYRVIQQNRSLLQPGDFRAIVAQDLTRPVVNWSYAIDRAIWGPAPFGFHLTNVLLHVLNVGLLFGLAWRLVLDRSHWDDAFALQIKRRPGVTAFATAVLFGLHPMMTEAVGYISGRTEVLSATFILGAFLMARRWMETRQFTSVVAAFVLWILALGSRETAVMLPLLLLYYDRVVRNDAGERRRHLWSLHVPLMFVTAVAAVARLTVFLSIEHGDRLTWYWRFAVAQLDVFTRYLALLIVPNGQTIFHAIPLTTDLLAQRSVVAAVTLGLVGTLLILTSRRGRIASFGLFWFLVVLVPPVVLVMLNRGEPMAERRVYLASMGLFIAIGAAVGYLAALPRADRGPIRRLLALGAVLVVILLGGRTVVRNAIWSSPVLLWAEAAEKAPDHWLPALVLGESLHNDGRHGEAVVTFKRALQLRPDQPAVYEHLGLCLIEVRDLDEAKATFNKLAQIAPRSAKAPNGLATAAMVDGDLEAARRLFLSALDVEPRNVEARLGLALIEKRPGGDSAEALRRCEEIRLIAPDAPGLRECFEGNRTPGEK